MWILKSIKFPGLHCSPLLSRITEWLVMSALMGSISTIWPAGQGHVWLLVRAEHLVNNQDLPALNRNKLWISGQISELLGSELRQTNRHSPPLVLRKWYEQQEDKRSCGQKWIWGGPFNSALLQWTSPITWNPHSLQLIIWLTMQPAFNGPFP